MERTYIVSLSGKVLRGSMAEAIESLSLIFSDKQPTDIERLIESKSLIKKSIDLNLANKIKTRIEQAGAECIISLEENQHTDQQPQKTLTEKIEIVDASSPSNHKSEGATYLSIALISILALFFISDGYDPRLGLLWSINENMTLYEGHPLGCKEISYPYAQGNTGSGIDYSRMGKAVGGCEQSFKLTVMTKYLLLALLIVFAFGIGRYLNHFKSINTYWQAVRKKMHWD